MKKKFLLCFAILFLLFGVAGFSSAAVIDFVGGTATLSDSTTVITTDTEESVKSLNCELMLDN